MDVAQLGALLDLLHGQGYRLVELTPDGLRLASVGGDAPKESKQPERQFAGRKISDIDAALGIVPRGGA